MMLVAILGAGVAVALCVYLGVALERTRVVRSGIVPVALCAGESRLETMAMGTQMAYLAQLEQLGRGLPIAIAVGVATASLVAMSGLGFGAAIGVLLAVTAAYTDLRARIVFDTALLPGAIAMLIIAFATHQGLSSLIGSAVFVGILAALAAMPRCRIYPGDFKLAAVSGLALTWIWGLVAGEALVAALGLMLLLRPRGDRVSGGMLPLAVPIAVGLLVGLAAEAVFSPVAPGRAALLGILGV